MRSKLCWLTAVFLFCAVAPESHGQGLFQRLRNRIRQNQQATPPNVLPPRPIPSPDDGTSTPQSNYRNRVVPIPADAESEGPTLEPGVKQASAEEDGGLRSGFGSSILARPGGFSRPEENVSIGIQAVNANPGYPGVQVRRFDDKSKADEAGLKTGDYIFAADGVATPNTQALVEQVAKHQPGETIRLRIGRDGRVSDIDVPLIATQITASKPKASLPESAVAKRPSKINPQIGAELTDVAGSRGVQVIAVRPGSPAATAGLEVGDRIVSVENRLVANADAFATTSETFSPDETVGLRVVRGQQLLQLELDLAAEASALPLPPSGPASTGTPTLATPAPRERSVLSGLGSAFGGMFGS
ncbi:MAG: PDZ domain-containing protein, partial [Planctomycetota bacterium]